MPSDDSSPVYINDLRLRVLNGDEIPPDEFARVIDQIRANRRTATPKVKPEKAAKRKPSGEAKLRGDDLDAILGIDL